MNLVPLILPDGFVCPYIELADTNLLWRRGLAGRDHLGPGQGMLFAFGGPGMHPMWMQGCLVDLDMVWLDYGLCVRQTLRGSKAGTLQGGRDGNPLSWYVLELAAGQAVAHGVIPGSQIRLVAPSS